MGRVLWQSTATEVSKQSDQPTLPNAAANMQPPSFGDRFHVVFSGVLRICVL